MKRILKATAAGLLTAAIAGAGLLGLATAAFAGGSAPPFEPDPGVTGYGSLAFYDAAGNQITSGTNDLSNPFSYVVASTATDTNANTSTVYFAVPFHGVATANWVQDNEASSQFKPTSDLPAGTPSDITTAAATDPVAATSTANITTWLAANASGLDATTGYANTIEVRLQDSGPSNAGNGGSTFYWRTDIGYNTTSSAITVDGTTVPADGWAVLYPVLTDNYTVLTTSATGGNLTLGNPITLTATVTSEATSGGTTGSVLWYDNGVALTGGTASGTTGTFTYTYTPSAAGTQNYTATFLPTGGGPGSTSAATVQVGAALIGTTTALAASSNSITYGTSDTLTATVGAADNSTTGVTGSVKFLDGTTPITGCTAQATTVTGAGTSGSPGVGTATCMTSGLPLGSDSITATFTPTSNLYSPSTSSAVVVTVQAGAICNLAGSKCTDTQNVQVTINPGTITIATPYTASNPFLLPNMVLSSDNTYLESSATFPGGAGNTAGSIVVTSQLSPAYAWTLSVSATSLTVSGYSGTAACDTAADIALGCIPSSGLGLTNGTLTDSGSYPGTVTFANGATDGIAALNPSTVDGGGTGPGLSSLPATWATSTAVDGTADMVGQLTLYASTATPAGTYGGTITFTVS